MKILMAVIAFIILAVLYLLVLKPGTPVNTSTDFHGPTGPPYLQGPTEPPPN